MPRDITRIPFEFPTHLVPIIDRIANERGLTRSGLIRVGLGLVQATHEASKDGLHTGIVRDREKLDTLLISPL